MSTLKPNGELIPVGGGDNIPLRRPKLMIGRRETCDVCLDFPNISSRHCEMTFRDGFWYIRDLNSTNGVKVNGSRVQEQLLRTLTGRRAHFSVRARRDPDGGVLLRLDGDPSVTYRRSGDRVSNTPACHRLRLAARTVSRRRRTRNSVWR